MKNLLLIASDASLLEPWQNDLAKAGWTVTLCRDAGEAVSAAKHSQAELVLGNLTTSAAAFFEFCRQFHLGSEKTQENILLAGVGENERPHKLTALEQGADDYLGTPLRWADLERVLRRSDFSTSCATRFYPQTPRALEENETRLKFWGVRGSIPSPGLDTVFYGGNTSCVEIRVGSEIIILDAGSGLRRLGLSLMEEFQDAPMQLNLLITHTHWDHIQGFPFFRPAYNPKNQINIYGFEGATRDLRSILSSQMESPYFPVSLQQMPSHIAICELHSPEFSVNKIKVTAHTLNHPGSCTGYRIATPGGSIAYLPDIELFHPPKSVAGVKAPVLPEDGGLAEFISGSDVLILDAQYDVAEYEQHVGWGHSCIEDCVAFAIKTKVKRLFLFHHDPEHNDERISRMVAKARQLAACQGSDLIVEAARESSELILPAH